MLITAESGFREQPPCRHLWSLNPDSSSSRKFPFQKSEASKSRSASKYQFSKYRLYCIRHIALSHITYLTLKSVSRIIFYFQMFINPNVFKSSTTIDFWCSTPTSITFHLPSTHSSCHQTAIVTRRPTEKSQTRKYVPLSKNKLPATQKSLQRALTIK